MKATATLVRIRALSGLKPYPGNPRTHSPAQVQEIASSIQRFGFTNPILLDEDGLVLAGHGRMGAAKILGLKVVPTIQLLGLTKAQKAAYVVADNKLGELSTWDQDALRREVEAIVGEGISDALVGFSAQELREAVMGWEELENDERVSEDYEPPVSAAVTIFCRKSQRDELVKLATEAMAKSGLDWYRVMA